MALQKMRGRAWVFGDILDVDGDIYPFGKMYAAIAKGGPDSLRELGKYCMISVDPDFPKKVKKGDFIVAGENMGFGHDHDTASRSILGAGVAAVICNSTNSYFFRNSTDVGLPVVEIPGIREATREGDEMELDLVEGTVKNLTRGLEYHFTPLPPALMERIEVGGLYPYIQREIAAGRL